MQRINRAGQGRKVLPAVAALLLVTSPAAVLAADDRWQVGTSPSFSSGRYGTEVRTDVLQTPVTARRLFEAGDLTLVVPATCITGNGDVTVVNGSPVRQQRSGTTDNSRGSGATTPPASDTRTGRGTAAPSSSGEALPPPSKNCGFGDLVVRGRYFLVDQRGWVPTIAVRGHLKSPTANAERGLGTGRFDEGVGLEVTRTLGGGAMAMLDGGYTFIGEAADAEFNNVWWYDAGIGKDFSSGAVNLSVFFEESRAIVPGLAPARDVLAAVSLKGSSGWRLQVSAQFGLSDGAPDHGISVGTSRRF
jgi:hypothetical protein